MKTLKNVFGLFLLATVFLACEEPVGPGDPNGRYGSDPIDQELEKGVTRNLTIAISYGVIPLYHIGCIYAQMGDTEKALKYLKEARESGYYIGHFHFKYDKHLPSLFEHPDFKSMNEPVWPPGYAAE